MRKSLFSPAIYRMWLRRYWVGGALMTLAFLLAAVAYSLGLAPARLYAQLEDPNQYALYINSTTISTLYGAFTSAAAVVAAMLCMGYLQNPRSAVMIHSLPPSRECLFFSTSAAGLTLLAAPILLSTLFLGAAQGLYGLFTPGPLFLWMGSMLGIAVLFFGAACLVGMFTGHVLAQGVLTVLLLNLPIMLEALVLAVCGRFLFGFVRWEPATQYINPYYMMARFFRRVETAASLSDPLPGWLPVAYLFIGAVLLGLALLLYRRRQVEAAGDVAAMRGIRPVFRFGLALGGATLLGNLFGSIPTGDSFAVQLVFGILGGVLGYFVAEMLLRRSVRVFRHFKGAAGFALVYLLVMLGLYTDVIGYGRYMLNPEAVEAIVFEQPNARVETALTGKTADLYSLRMELGEGMGLQDENGWLATLHKGRDPGPIPVSIAGQIIRQDKTVYIGQDIAAAVDFQHLLAANSKELGRQQNLRSGYDNQTYYHIPVLAKMKDGSVFRRYYNFSLPTGDQGDISTAWAEIELRNLRANQINTLWEVGGEAEALTLNYHLPYGPNGVSTHTLNKGEWDGLLEAYRKDLETKTDFSSPAMIEIAINTGTASQSYGSYFYPAILLLSPEDTATIEWLKGRGLLDDDYISTYRLAREQEAEAEKVWAYEYGM